MYTLWITHVTFAQEKTWLQVEISNIEFDIILFKVEFLKIDCISNFKYFDSQELHEVVYICIF